MNAASNPSPLPAYAPEELTRLSKDELLHLFVADEDSAPRSLVDEYARRGVERPAEGGEMDRIAAIEREGFGGREVHAIVPAQAELLGQVAGAADHVFVGGDNGHLFPVPFELPDVLAKTCGAFATHPMEPGQRSVHFSVGDQVRVQSPGALEGLAHMVGARLGYVQLDDGRGVEIKDQSWSFSTMSEASFWPRFHGIGRLAPLGLPPRPGRT